MATLQFSAVTAEGVTLDEPVSSVTVPTTDGEITVLPNHIPLVSVLAPGVVTVRPAGNEQGEAGEHHLAVSGGFLQVTGSAVRLLADTAERADQIDLERAEQARKRAEEVMLAKAEREGLADASATLQKNLARLRAAELAGKRRTRGRR